MHIDLFTKKKENFALPFFFVVSLILLLFLFLLLCFIS